MIEIVLVESGKPKLCTNIHFLKKVCNVSILLAPEFMRPHESRKMSAELVHSGESNIILETVSGE